MKTQSGTVGSIEKTQKIEEIQKMQESETLGCIGNAGPFETEAAPRLEIASFVVG